MDILEKVRRGTVLGDGGYVFELERRGYIQAGPFTPEVVLEHPAAVLALHGEFLRSGAEVLQALTFYGDEPKLAQVGYASEIALINREAVRLAREAAGTSALVSGCITQTAAYQPGATQQDAARHVMARQVELQVQGGVDFIIGETFIHLNEALLAVRVMKEASLPVVLTMNIGPQGSKEGYSAEDCARRLADAGADIVGVNCSFGPDVALAAALSMKAAVSLPIACQPVCYETPSDGTPFTHLPEFPLELEKRLLTRFHMADFARQTQASGIRFIGGCCGVAPYHLRAMAEALGRNTPSSNKSPDLSRHALPEVRNRSQS